MNTQAITAKIKPRLFSGFETEESRALTLQIHIYGIVQGVGFRPFTAVTAARCGIRGTVANKGSYVEIVAQGTQENIFTFLEQILKNPPDRAMILSIDSEEIDDAKATLFRDFQIIESEKEYGDIFVSPDIATCNKCRTELFEMKNRRYLHPFINCTQCGPRLTILDTMPYDRERTSMREFPMCSQCAAEYHDPATRRYDAQPNCCNDCGPEVYIIGTKLRSHEAISAVRCAVSEGKIAAIKGIGGFHLCCDARNAAAVQRLRTLKNRPAKPFAVMMRDLQTVERECIIHDSQREMLTGWQKPILLLEKRAQMTICNNIAPDNRTVGVMLPYAPVQMLLFDYPDGVQMTDCLVMTSGNVRGAPICRNDEDAVREIGGFCDLILSHNRKIRLRADDSVCDWLNGRPYMIRRSRGFAPLPVMIHQKKHPQILAIGGELKNSFCIAKGGLLYASPYIGDMADIRTVNALRESADRMCGLLEAKPEAVVCDTHPLYNTVSVAREIAQELDIPLIQVQHHYAHILSCMAENNVTDPVIGLSFDGTGYGDDGTIWGGELLVCDTKNYRSAGSIQPFLQIGGDLSAREGWRIAAALLHDVFSEDAQKICESLGVCSAQEYKLLINMSRMGINTIRSTSCGRIFDAVAAILGIRRASSFEGEASAALMNAAEQYYSNHGDSLPEFPLYCKNNDGFLIMQTTDLVAEIVKSFLSDCSPENRLHLAYQFHVSLAELCVQLCIKTREDTGISVCALSGGVFQNRLLTRITIEKLTASGFTVLQHSLIPPNDGGICIGQALYGVYNAE
ncbi:MAG: carbamoyltransferase HypF [Oscillospiraceae bacterium]|nr:carbamoyltransferase HypF [Oscillospiraceae bacterium]